MVTTVSRCDFLRGAAGGAAVAAIGTESAVAQEGGQTHTIDMTDDLVFDPDDYTIAPGDTVVWENVGEIGHSVTAYEEDIPEEATYFASGGFEAEQPARTAYTAGDPASGDVVGGESFEHTFEVTGTYDYFCVPHESVGMVAQLTVQEGGGTPEPGAQLPQVPDSAKSLVMAAMTALLVVVGLAYFFLKYGGYEQQEE
ncbi:MAG: plastocyanin/azurin family copper-binding protein [Halobacteriota archaeon]